MRRLFLVRHAQADGHDAADPGLSETGVLQARALARRLRGEDVAAIRHGPRRRTTETARLVGEELGLDRLVSSEHLDDRTAVPSESRRHEYPRHRWPWLDEVPADERDVDGHRLSAAWRAVSEDRGAETAVLVTHAFVVAWFVREVLEAPDAAWTRLIPDNTGLTVVRWADAGEASIEAFNDTGHLRA